MIEFVVSVELSMFDPLKMALATLKASMVKAYSFEIDPDVEVDTKYSECFNYIVARFFDSGKALILLDKLAKTGCSDIHVYCNNEYDLKFMQGQYGDLFRFCECEFKA